MRQQKTRGKLRIAVPLTFFGWGLVSYPFGVQATSPVLGPPPPKECVRGRNPNDYFPFPGQREVTIYGDANARKGIARFYVEEAAKNWDKACQQKLHVPHFVVNWEHDRPSSEDPKERWKIFTSTILVIFSPDEKAYYDIQIAATPVAKWSPNDNSITFFGKCGNGEIRRPCEMPLEKGRNSISIAWQSDWGSMAITHEIGHVLGLDHDSVKCKMRGIMRAVVNKNDTLNTLPILPEYCRLVDDINNEDAPCANIKTDSTEHPCNNPELIPQYILFFLKLYHLASE